MVSHEDGRVYLPNSTGCFVCGEENPAGLQTRFYVEDGVVKTPLAAAAQHCGYKDVVHGGVVAAVLDECMGWAAARAIQRMCLTAELTVRYLNRMPRKQTMTVCAKVVRSHRRLVHVEGQIVDDGGQVYARGTGRFTPLSAEETLTVDDAMLYRGGEERVFDGLRQKRSSQ